MICWAHRSTVTASPQCLPNICSHSQHDLNNRVQHPSSLARRTLTWIIHKIGGFPKLRITFCFLACSAADAETDLSGAYRPKPRRIDLTVNPRGFACTACCTPRPLAACYGSDPDSVM